LERIKHYISSILYGVILMREEKSPFEFLEETNRLMRSGGLLLVSAGRDGKPNAMTIGWGLIGTVWRRPIFCVAVRISRHTYRLIEENKNFTVCLPALGMENILQVCGTKSGRDIDKFSELGLTVEDGITVDAPYIGECPVHYECKVVNRSELNIGDLSEEINGEIYASRDYHVLYFGSFKGVYAVDDAYEKLS
jgi:flavin reductase (DIM6/NTAB) family NADH-FMN oxidoreductase RutF